MTKVAVIIGTRPEVIKLAPVVRALRERIGDQEVKVYSTGQHRELFAQALNSLKIRIDHDFSLMAMPETSGDIQNKIVANLKQEFAHDRPDIVIVQGDTISAFSGAMAAFLSNVPVAHVEAGLRTFDLQNPWPEEGLRQMIARITSLHLAPTPQARQNLLQEGVPKENIHIVGNPGIDTLVSVQAELGDQARQRTADENQGSKLALVTMHRREALSGKLDLFCQELRAAIEQNKNCTFLWPAHPNPAVREVIGKHFSDNTFPYNLKIVEPLPYKEMIAMLNIADLVISDSGGMQEEAPYCGVPIIVVREVTERPEIIELELGCLVGSEAKNLSEKVSAYLDTKPNPDAVTEWQRIQGQGQAADKIARLVADFI
jgi:UDP-N-acetylglucosamine 2-epimerase (non-hydrolysing)